MEKDWNNLAEWVRRFIILIVIFCNSAVYMFAGAGRHGSISGPLRK
jgi:hypothetical protein